MKANAFETALLQHLYNNSAVANVGDATGLPAAATAGSLYVGLHTAYPGETGDQTSNEATYTGYSRAAVARNSGGWTVSGNQVSNTAAIEFAQCTGGSDEIQYWSVGVASSGPSLILHMGLIGSTALPLPFTAKADDTITIPGHSLSVNHRVAFFPIPGGTLPTGITAGTLYFVKTVSGDDITISTTQGGSAVDITAAGTGVVQRAIPLTVTEPIVPRFQAGQLIIVEE